jgi:hypothetical protein
MNRALTELSPSWDAANCVATQEIPNTSWNPKVHKSLLPVPILSHINPIHTIPSYLSEIHLNILYPLTSWFLQWSLSPWLSHQYPVRIRAILPAYPMFLHLIILTWRRVKIMKLFIMQFFPTSKYSSQYPVLNILSLWSYLNVRDQVSHPYRTTDKIIVLYILMQCSRFGIVERLRMSISGRNNDIKWLHYWRKLYVSVVLQFHFI